jgi:imidazolonepropionase-like amidohydrolase
MPEPAVARSHPPFRLGAGLGWLGAALALWLLLAAAPSRSASAPSEAADLEAAHALFERNLDAIRNRDAAAYLSCYLPSENLARTGPTGFALGYEGLAASTGQAWPEVFEGLDLALVRVLPGVVYGTYRYRVRFGEVEQSGLSERLFVSTPDGWKIAVSTAFPATPGVPPPARALVGATLVDGTGGEPVEEAVVLVRDGRIECAGTAEECPIPGEPGEGEETSRVDLSGRWITPGVIDAHVHFSQTGWADGRPDAIDARKAGYPYEEASADLAAHPDRFYRTYLCSGVTGVFDVGGYPWTLDLPNAVENDTWAPHVAAAGGLLSTVDHWLNQPGERQLIYLADDAVARNGVRWLAARGAAAIKVWLLVNASRTLEETKPVVAAVGEEASRHGLPLIVHATGLAEAKVAVRAGARLLVHSVDDQPIDDELLDLMAEHQTVYSPTLTVARGYWRLFEAAAAGVVPEVDDPNGCVDAVTRGRLAATPKLAEVAPGAEQRDRMGASLDIRERQMAENLARVVGAGIPVAMGTDAGNPLTLHGQSVYAEMEAMQAAGMSPMQVLVASTRNGARAMGRADDLGTLEEGKIADLLVLNADPTADVANFRQLGWVMRGGVLRAVAELRPLEPRQEPEPEPEQPPTAADAP